MLKAWRPSGLKVFSGDTIYMVWYSEEWGIFNWSNREKILVGEKMKVYTKKAAGMKEGQMQEIFRRQTQKDLVTLEGV